jgi:hypothetical protein
MVRSLRCLVAVSMAWALLGCPGLMKKQGDDGGASASASASAAPSASVAPAAPVAANDADVTHYPDQVAGTNETLTTRMTVAARTEASATGGKLVTEVRAGTATQKLADHEGYELVTFPDPKDSSQTLEGWINKTAFAYVPVPVVHDGGPGPAPACTAGPSDIHQTNGNCAAPYAKCGAGCRLQCSKDSDCCGTPGKTCQGGMCGGACH